MMNNEINQEVLQNNSEFVLEELKSWLIKSKTNLDKMIDINYGTEKIRLKEKTNTIHMIINKINELEK